MVIGQEISSTTSSTDTAPGDTCIEHPTVGFKNDDTMIPTMKLAEALKTRADLNQRLYHLQERLVNNSKVQEGEEPGEDPVELLAELDTVTSQLEDLIRRINVTNSTTSAGDGETITSLIARRDVLIRKADILRTFINEASRTVNRHSPSEIKVVSTVNVRDLMKRVDDISKEIRVTDTRIQELNWTTDLI